MFRIPGPLATPTPQAQRGRNTISLNVCQTAAMINCGACRTQRDGSTFAHSGVVREDQDVRDRKAFSDFRLRR